MDLFCGKRKIAVIINNRNQNKKCNLINIFIISIIFLLFYSSLSAANISQDVTSGNGRSPFMVFVSFSMPKKMLQDYFEAAQKVHGSLVLCGLVNQSLSDTFLKIHEIMQNKSGGLMIDPVAFEKLNISQVPAIVLLKQKALDCLDTPNCVPSIADYDVVYGDISVDSALSLFQQKELKPTND